MIIDRLPGFGTVEIHQVQALGSLPLPFEGLGHWVITKSGDLAVVALVQPNAVAIQQVNGGDDLHDGRSAQRLPARLPEAPVPQMLEWHHKTHGAIEYGLDLQRAAGAFALFSHNPEVPVSPAQSQSRGLGGPLLGQLHPACSCWSRP